jgi:hypothetical protein
LNLSDLSDHVSYVLYRTHETIEPSAGVARVSAFLFARNHLWHNNAMFVISDDRRLLKTTTDLLSKIDNEIL